MTNRELFQARQLLAALPLLKYHVIEPRLQSQSSPDFPVTASTATTGNLYGLAVEAITVLVTSPVAAWYFL